MNNEKQKNMMIPCDVFADLIILVELLDAKLLDDMSKQSLERVRAFTAAKVKSDTARKEYIKSKNSKTKGAWL